MKQSKFFLTISIAVMLAGCAHGVMRGTVAMKTSDSEAHVCLGDGEVKPGDRVTLFRSVCSPKGPGSRPMSGKVAAGTCERIEIGKGTVEQLLNKHYSLVKFDTGVSFEEGTFVEKE